MITWEEIIENRREEWPTAGPLEILEEFVKLTGKLIDLTYNHKVERDTLTRMHYSPVQITDTVIGQRIAELIIYLHFLASKYDINIGEEIENAYKRSIAQAEAANE